MFQVRIHGRGGQGVVTSAEMLSVAAFAEDRHAQAFPSFGSERMGAPVIAFCRIDDKTIRMREPIANPDAVIIADPTLLHQVDLFNGLRPDGYVLINSTRTLEELGIAEFAATFPDGHVRCVPATEVALKYVGKPLPNAALLGAFAAMTGTLHLESVVTAIEDRFAGKVAAANASAARACFEEVRSQMKESQTVA